MKHKFINMQTSWLSIFLLLSHRIVNCAASTNQILYTQGSDCGKEIELGSATVYSHYRPDTVAHYSHSQECQITFIAERENWKLQVKFEYLDIPDFLYNGVCTDALYLYDSNTIGQRAFRAAGQNGGLCGNTLPPIITSTGPYISVFFRTDVSGVLGRGFKFEISAVFQVEDGVSSDGPFCSLNDFYCFLSSTCIESAWLCDGISHCANGEDEDDNGASQCNPLEESPVFDLFTPRTTDSAASVTTESSIWQTIMSLGVAGFIGVVIGGLVILILLIVCVICTCRRCGKKPGEAEHRPSIPSSTHGTVGAGQPQQQIIKDGITYQQVPQTSAGPTNPNIMQNPMNQYPQAGGLNRYPQNGGMNQYPQQPGYCVSLNQQQMPVVLSQVQRPGYLSQQPAMEMQLQAQPMMSCSGGPSAPSQTLPSGGAYMGGYNSPFHLARGPESHSYSSGYSSQQGPAAGFHPMHTKPIISQRAYTPTSGSSRSSRSRSESSVTYNKGDNHQHHDRQRAVL